MYFYPCKELLWEADQALVAVERERSMFLCNFNRKISFAIRNMTKSERAGLTFPVARIGRFLKKGKYANRVGTGISIVT